MTFPRKREPESVEDHLALLPSGLRSFVDRECAAGNAVAEAGTGFPAAPVGVWIKLAQPFLTVQQAFPEEVVHRERPHNQWPAECTDPPRHFFVLSGVQPETPPMPAPREESTRPVTAGKPKTPFGRIPQEQDLQYPRARDVAADWGLNARVSEAIEAHLSLLWTDDEKARMRKMVGVEGLQRIVEMNDFANRPDFWTTHDNMEGYEEIQRELRERYPFLSAGAISRLATRAAWGWR